MRAQSRGFSDRPSPRISGAAPKATGSRHYRKSTCGKLNGHVSNTTGAGQRAVDMVPLIRHIAKSEIPESRRNSARRRSLTGVVA
jgi:hypothetical protein